MAIFQFVAGTELHPTSEIKATINTMSRHFIVVFLMVYEVVDVIFRCSSTGFCCDLRNARIRKICQIAGRHRAGSLERESARSITDQIDSFQNLGNHNATHGTVINGRSDRKGYCNTTAKDGRATVV